MKGMRIRDWRGMGAGILLAVVITACLSIGVWAQEQGENESLGESLFGYHANPELEFIDQDGNVVTYVTLGASEGDAYIDEENNQFVVRRVDGTRVYVENQGKAEMPDVSDALAALEQAKESGGRAQVGIIERLLSAVGQNRGGAEVGIYHTHNAESYRPTSGVEFKDEGDVLKVGQALKEAFEKHGYKVAWSEASHLPHDGEAYLRSRRTAADISKSRPATIIDVHRDAIPRADSYTTEVNGERMTQVRLVVGRQNQNREANLEYAKRIKAIADEKFPGLIKGIYHARGNYNQDLGPRMILLEFGTHVTSLDEATRSTPLIAEAIVAAAGLAAGAGDGENVGAAGSRSFIWILLLVGAGVIGWYFLNKEGWFRRSGGGGPERGDG